MKFRHWVVTQIRTRKKIRLGQLPIRVFFFLFFFKAFNVRSKQVPRGRFGQAPLMGAELSKQRHLILLSLGSCMHVVFCIPPQSVFVLHSLVFVPGQLSNFTKFYRKNYHEFFSFLRIAPPHITKIFTISMVCTLCTSSKSDLWL